MPFTTWWPREISWRLKRCLTCRGKTCECDCDMGIIRYISWWSWLYEIILKECRIMRSLCESILLVKKILKVKVLEFFKVLKKNKTMVRSCLYFEMRTELFDLSLFKKINFVYLIIETLEEGHCPFSQDIFWKLWIWSEGCNSWYSQSQSQFNFCDMSTCIESILL